MWKWLQIMIIDPIDHPTFLTCCWYVQKSGKIKSQCYKNPGNYQDKIPPKSSRRKPPPNSKFPLQHSSFWPMIFYDAQTFTVSWARFSKLAEKLPKQIRLPHGTQKEQPILDGCLMFQPFPRQNVVSFIKGCFWYLWFSSPPCLRRFHRPLSSIKGSSVPGAMK